MQTAIRWKPATNRHSYGIAVLQVVFFLKKKKSSSSGSNCGRLISCLFVSQLADFRQMAGLHCMLAASSGSSAHFLSTHLPHQSASACSSTGDMSADLVCSDAVQREA
jgi:hypothetical protein